MEGKRRITKKGGNLMEKSSAMAMHRDSHIISKPKIRIIHIFAPEIIKTDVANFRELVQRLTGKPSENTITKPPVDIPAMIQNRPDVNNFSNFRGGFGSLEEMKQIRSSVKKEQVEEQETTEEEEDEEDEDEEEEEAKGMIWNGEDSEGYFGGFSDFEGFIKELGEFPLLPLDVNSHQLMHGFEEETTQFL